MTQVASKKRVGRSTKQVTPVSQGSEPEQSHQGSQTGGPNVMDILLEISSQLQQPKLTSLASRRQKGYTTEEVLLS